MKLLLKNPPKNITLLIRGLSYHPDRNQKSGTLGFSRRISNNDYPKFHAYFNKQEDGTIWFNLHLDMKQPSYSGTHAHAGEYEGDMVKEEFERIISATRL